MLLATQLKRTDSMVSPQLFHFDDHFEFEEVIGRSSMSEVRDCMRWQILHSASLEFGRLSSVPMSFVLGRST